MKLSHFLFSLLLLFNSKKANCLTRPKTQTQNFKQEVIKKLHFDTSVSTFALATVLRSTHRFFTPSPQIENFAWTLALPASLVLSVIGSKRQTSSKTKTTVKFPMIIAFLFGVVGSSIGGLSSFLSASAVASLFRKTTNYNICSSCLTSSYIGGTVNFFECASNIIMSDVEKQSINQLAAADIGIMIAYFWFLTLLKRRKNSSNLNDKSIIIEEVTNQTNKNVEQQNEKQSLLRSIVLYFSLTALSFSITFYSSLLQKRIGLPGLSIMIATIVATFVNWLIFLPIVYRCFGNNITSEVSKTSKDVAGYLLLVFYAILGFSSRIQDILQLGLPILSLFLTMLTVHITVIFGGSFIWNKTLNLFYKIRKSPAEEKNTIDLDSILIASNACVGGAATAASMAVSFNRSDLVFSAGLVGVLGYMIGTPIGLYVHKIILNLK